VARGGRGRSEGVYRRSLKQQTPGVITQLEGKKTREPIPQGPKKKWGAVGGGLEVKGRKKKRGGRKDVFPLSSRSRMGPEKPRLVPEGTGVKKKKNYPEAAFYYH